MASLPLSVSSLATVKKTLRRYFPDVRSSHLTEALAASLRRKTHAALQAQLSGYISDPPIELLDASLFHKRLLELGYSTQKFDFDTLTLDDGVIPTTDGKTPKIEYLTARSRAWRNLMVCAINEGLHRKLFSLKPDDNRWPGSGQGGYLFNFILPNGLPARAYVTNIGWAELSIHVAANPRGDLVCAGNAGFSAGDAFAAGWLERERGAWIQSSTSLFNCRTWLVRPLADFVVQPAGYGDRGRVIN